MIAEIGINHNGDLKICKQLIRIAKDAGCDAVKFQKRTLENVYTKEQLESYRESPWGKTTYAQKKGLEFNFSQYKQIDKLSNIFCPGAGSAAWAGASGRGLMGFKSF